MKKATLRATASAFALLGAGFTTAAMVAAPAAAQDYTSAALSGTVQDEGGNAIAGATVQLVSLDLGFTRSATSGANGDFRFSAIPAGNYDLVVSRDGAEVYRAEALRLLASQNANVSVVLPGGGSSDDVIVIQGSQLINDFEGTTTGLNVDLEELVKTVPIGRDLTSVVLLAPGTTQGDSAFGNLASIGGSSVAENAYYLNGLNITNFDNYLGAANVPFDMYRSVEVKSGGYPAEFGRATGGIVNAVTKSGSNDFFGGVHLRWSPNWARWEGKELENCTYNDPTSPEDGISCEDLTNRGADSADSYSAVIEAGLPVIRDHLFLYGLVEFRETETVGISRPSGLATKNTQDDPFWGLKADFYPIQSQHFEFTLFDTRRTTEQQRAPYTETGDGGYSIGQFNDTANFNFGGLNYVGKWTGNMTDWLTLSAAYGVMNDRFDNVALGSSASEPPFVNFSGQTVEGFDDGSFISNQTTTSTVAPYETKREFYRGDVDLYFNALGDHHIRAGFDVEKTSLSKATIYNGGDFLLANGFITPEAYNAGNGQAGIYYIIFPGRRSDGNQGLVVDQIYFNSGGTFEGTNKAYYIQDEWSVTDRLTLNLGLRRDDFNLLKADGSPFLDLKENYAPRIGFTYDLWPEQNGKLFGFYGQYFLPVASNTSARSAGAEFFFRERFDFEGIQTVGGAPLPIFGNQITSAVDPRYGIACPFRLNPGAAGGSTCRLTGDGSVPPSDAFFGADLKATKQSEYILGYEHDFGGFTAGLTYIHRTLDRTAEDAAIDHAVRAYCDAEGIAGCDAVWPAFHQYVVYNVGEDLTVRLDGGSLCNTDPRACEVVTLSAEDLAYPKPTRTYDAVELSFNRPFDGKWSLGGSYTWSRSFGNSEGYVQSDFGQDDAGITQDFDAPGFTEFAEGLLPNHRRHRIKLFGAYSLVENFTLGTNISIESPRPLSCFGFHPTDQAAVLYGAASHYCGLQPAPRGEGLETDWFTNVDLSARYNVPFSGDRLITFGVDMFNVLNTQGVTQRYELGDQEILEFNDDGSVAEVLADPQYGVPTGYQAARSVRFGIDVAF